MLKKEQKIPYPLHNACDKIKLQENAVKQGIF